MQPRHVLLKCLCQASKVRGRVFLCLGVYRFCFSIRFFYCILEMFRQYGSFCFSVYHRLCNIYSTVFQVKRLTQSNSRKTVVFMNCSMTPCNITSRSLIIARLSESNKTTAQNLSVQYLVSAFLF